MKTVITTNEFLLPIIASRERRGGGVVDHNQGLKVICVESSAPMRLTKSAKSGMAFDRAQPKSMTGQANSGDTCSDTWFGPEYQNDGPPRCHHRIRGVNMTPQIADEYKKTIFHFLHHMCKILEACFGLGCQRTLSS